MIHADVTIGVEEWLDALTRARDEGYAVFDFLAAVDAGEGDLDVVVRVLAICTDDACHPDKSVAAPEGCSIVPRALMVRTRVPAGARLSSLTGLWPGAAWHEREAFEMYGLVVSGFDDGTGLGLRRLLLPDADSVGVPAAPLRKDVPLPARQARPWPGERPASGGEGPR